MYKCIRFDSEMFARLVRTASVYPRMFEVFREYYLVRFYRKSRESLKSRKLMREYSGEHCSCQRRKTYYGPKTRRRDPDFQGETVGQLKAKDGRYAT